MKKLQSLLSQLTLYTLRLPFYIRYSMSLILIYIAYLVKIFALPFTNQGIFSIFYVAITISAWLGGIGPAIFSTVLSIFVVEFFFLLPETSFSFRNNHNIILIFIYFLEGVLITFIVGFMHRYMVKVQENLEDLQKSEQKFKQLYDANLIGIAFWSMDGYIREANDECLHVFGYTQEDLAKEPYNWITNTPSEYKKSDEKAIKQLKAKGICTPFVKEFYRKDGSRINVLIAAALLEDSIHDGVAYILDITEEKKAEQQRDLFIGFVSHELKNPLSSIKAYTQLLKRQLTIEKHTKEMTFIAKVEEKIILITRLLNDMLDITKLRAGKLEFIDEEFNLNLLMKNIVDDMQKINPQYQLMMHGAIQTKMISDRTRISQIFTNLLSNAIKYSPKEKKVTIHLQEERQIAVISIQDFGIGISPAEQKNIFEPLYRSQNIRAHAFPGTGLGLYITFEIVRHYGGNITLVSEQGKGSTFTIQLPFKQKGK